MKLQYSATNFPSKALPFKALFPSTIYWGYGIHICTMNNIIISSRGSPKYSPTSCDWTLLRQTLKVCHVVVEIKGKEAYRNWGKRRCKVRFPKVAGSQVLSLYFIYIYKTHTREIAHKKDKC